MLIIKCCYYLFTDISGREYFASSNYLRVGGVKAKWKNTTEEACKKQASINIHG